MLNRFENATPRAACDVPPSANVLAERHREHPRAGSDQRADAALPKRPMLSAGRRTPPRSKYASAVGFVEIAVAT